MLLPELKRLFFGLGPIIKVGTGLIAALDIEFVSATADAFFERRRLDRFAVAGMRSPPA
jgi:hypothetical protein